MTQAGARERSEFTPPPEPALLRSIGFALLAHAVLVAALSWGLKWKRDDQNVTVEAELWSTTVQQAAPAPAPPPPPPAPPPPAPARAVAPPPPPAPREADIAVERNRREAQAKARQEEAERQKQLAERRREEQARKDEQAKKAADERRRRDQAEARARQQDEERLAQQREQNLRRMQGLAGATGVREATGNATQSSGPSANYAGRLAAIFQRNVVFPGGVDSLQGNPVATVQVKVSPSGSILSARLAKSSGNPAWDEAAVRAIERSERIPPDEDGRYVSDFPVEMRPRR